MQQLHSEILKALLYYDIWSYPLTMQELYTFLPVNSMTLDEFKRSLHEQGTGGKVLEYQGYYFVEGKCNAIVTQRKTREHHAKLMWRMARISAHVIKRCPFVRGVFVSGDLSKNVTHPKSDVDFFIITAPGRLWIARMLLILFKKTVLLNRRKFFCLNYFATTDHLTLDEQNLFLATEVAHLKPLCNTTLFLQYLNENMWIKRFFPNFDIGLIPLPRSNERTSFIQKILEFPFRFIPADKLDEYLMKKMEAVWARRYPEFDEETRSKIFRCTRHESRAYVGNFQEKVLALYSQRLREFGVVE